MLLELLLGGAAAGSLLNMNKTRKRDKKKQLLKTPKRIPRHRKQSRFFKGR